MRKRYFFYGITILYMALIFYLSSIPPPPGPAPPLIFPHQDKVMHMVEYALLGILFFFSFQSERSARRVFLLAVSASIVYGITDEIHQYFVPRRVCSLADVLADVIGAVGGSGLSFGVTNHIKPEEIPKRTKRKE